VEFEGVDVSWRSTTPRHALHIWGLQGTEDESGTWLASVDRAQFAVKGGAVEAKAVSVTLGRGEKQRRLQRIEAAEATVLLELASPGSAAPAAAHDAEQPDASQPAPSASRLGKAARGQQASARSGLATGAPSGRGSAAPTASRVQGVPSDRKPGSAVVNGIAAEWRSLRTRLATSTDQQFRASVTALSVEAHRDREAVRIGPSQLTIGRQQERLAASLVPHAASANSGTPLRAKADIPLGEGPIELDLSGGPVSLSALGIREGDFGLMGVREAQLEADAHLVLDQDLNRARVTSKGRLERVRLQRRALATNELSDIRLGWRLNGAFSLDGTEMTLADAEVSLGDVRAQFSGTMRRDVQRSAVELSVEVPVAACETLLDSLPRGMAPLLDGVRMQGTFAVDAKFKYDSQEPAATQARLTVKNQCRIAEVPPAIAPSRFRNRWLREVKGPDGLPMPLESGPGSADFTPYEEISPYMETAILVCEDGGFFGHQGLDYRAIENSVKQNVAVGRFLRGASTVSMQLAKNLYLGREKTLSRKLQEAVLTLLLEQELSKHDLLELYLNVIEFGPGVYGIRQAARYYFNQEPRDLSLAQALYLGSILPSPDRSHFRPDGRVSEGWSEYLRKLMHVARKRGRISQEELERGLLEQVEFRKPSSEADRSQGLDSDWESDFEPELPPTPPEEELP
jgi:hypothetical protein